MRRLLLGTSAIVALVAAQPSRAADFSPLPAKMPVATTLKNWTGCYAGAQAGGGALSDNFINFSGGGGIAGGQLGCNVQTGQIVFGLEGEAAWSSLSNSNIRTDAFSSSNTTDRNRWSADLAVRAGVAVDRALIYGKAGVATGGFSSSLSDTTPGDFTNGSGTLSGPLLGFGIEVAFAPNWSARLEYDHIDYVGKTLHFDRSAAQGGPFDTSTSFQTNIVKAGINYRFGGSDFALAADQPAWSPIYKAPATKAPTAAYDWTGCYLGASAGGGILSDSFDGGVNGGGGIVGGQLGCNYQTGQIVWGIEGEAASGLKDHFNSNAFSSSENTGRNRWSADLAARAGVAIDRALIYGKVGVARGGIDVAFNQTGGAFENASGTLTGILFGFGLEVAFAPHWSVRLEYDHFDYLGKTLPFNVDGVVIAPRDLTVSAQANLVKAGVNYQFGGSDRPFAAAPARPILPMATYNWTGCYAGVHGGGGVLSDPFVNSDGPPINGSGGVAGGQAGCDIQRGQIVWGVEGEAAWSGLKNNFVFNQPAAAAFGPGSSQQFTSSIRWSADLAARAGIAVGRALIYGKAGIASSRFDFAENLAFNDGSFSSFLNGSAVLTGLVFGAGLEYALVSNWSAKFEFDRIDYRARGVPFASGSTNINGAFSNPFSQTETAATNVAKIGVNYRFFGGGGDPAVAKY